MHPKSKLALLLRKLFLAETLEEEDAVVFNFEWGMAVRYDADRFSLDMPPSPLSLIAQKISIEVVFSGDQPNFVLIRGKERKPLPNILARYFAEKIRNSQEYREREEKLKNYAG